MLINKYFYTIIGDKILMGKMLIIFEALSYYEHENSKTSLFLCNL